MTTAPRNAVAEEAWGLGPLETLISDPDCDEVILNGASSIWTERKGRLEKTDEHFASEESYRAFVNRFLIETDLVLDLRNPIGDTSWRTFRVHAVLPPVVESPKVTLRRIRAARARFGGLLSECWAPEFVIERLKQLLHEQRNILVAGPTSSGKTTLIQALLEELNPNERCLIVEDTPELQTANSASVALRTRSDHHQVLPEVGLGELVRQALRMRPDRLVLGEVRGPEARDLVLALSSGHRGSLGSIHARDAAEAIRRLEICVQLGAPTWSLDTIRRLIGWSIDAVAVVGRCPQHRDRRQLVELAEITGVEDHGLLLEQIWSAQHSGAAIEKVSPRK